MKPFGSIGEVVMYDPGFFLPYYVDGLCRHLAPLGVRARVIASPPLFEPVDTAGLYDVDALFFQGVRGAARDIVRRRRFVRWAVKGLSYPSGLLRTWRALTRRAPGVLHVQWVPVPTLDLLLVRRLKARGWRVVYTVHDPLLPASRGARAQRELLESSDVVIVHTSWQRQEIVAAVPSVTERVRVIPHGATRFPLPSSAERARERERLRLPAGRALLLFFGQIKRYKGLAHLLEAMPNVIAGVPDALLVIAGEPLMPMRTIEQTIDALGLRDHVVLRPGFVPSREAPAYFRAADLSVVPYVKAGASGVVLMAHGHGLPTVVTSAGGLPEFVDADQSGFVVPPADPEALAAAIRRALADRPGMTRMGERAWHRLALESDWSDVAEQTLAAYRGGTASPRGSTPARVAVTAHGR